MAGKRNTLVGFIFLMLSAFRFFILFVCAHVDAFCPNQKNFHSSDLPVQTVRQSDCIPERVF